MTSVVIGGGIGGLATAHYLLRHRVGRVLVLESTHRLGGWVETTRQADGVCLEHGPRTIRPAGDVGANTLELIEEIGLADAVKPISYGHPATLNRMVMVDGGLHLLPNSFGSIFKKLKPFDRPLVFAGIKEMFTRQKKCEDESLYDFMARRFGADVAKYAVDPMVRGICAGDSKNISAAAFALGPLFRLEQEHGGVIRGAIKSALTKKKAPPPTSDLVKKARADKWMIYSLDNGLQTLAETLGSSLETRGVEIRTGTPVTELRHKGDKMAVVTPDDVIEADHVYAACPSFATAAMLDQPELVSLLESIPFVTCAVVNVEFAGPVCPTDGFGFLVPSNQDGVPILGAIFDTCPFPQGDRTVFTVMMGGQWYDKYFGESATVEDFETTAVEQVRKVMKIRDLPVRVTAKLQRDCIAQYTVGHLQRVRRAREFVRGKRMPLSLVGVSYDGVGLNDTIMSAKNTVIGNYAK